MDAKESDSELTMESLMKELSSVLVPPDKEEWEMTARGLSQATGTPLRTCSSWLAKSLEAGLLVRRKVRDDRLVVFAYSPPGEDKLLAWQELIKKLQEE